MIATDLSGRPLPFGPWTLPEAFGVSAGSVGTIYASSHFGLFALAAGTVTTIGGFAIWRTLVTRRASVSKLPTDKFDEPQRSWMDGESEVSTQVLVSETARADLTKRIEAVHAAVLQLDVEWLSYEQDLEAYFLAKPILRDRTVRQIAQYNDALYLLREMADALTESSSEHQIHAAEYAAETALIAWGVANDYASQVGISDRSPIEKAALRRLHGLVGQLADPGTPREMWANLARQIDREMTKLTTVRVTWLDLKRIPALAHRQTAELSSSAGMNQVVEGKALESGAARE
ncbi:hypothetical protein [Mycobacteroides abscessus]|uniref:hypothetical protein n=1 Tax=Mycobacteroides abscessus TaxID=36809 RepID=UPI001042195A|nr:hypothetical protein [Mycobacteroides abscessus]